MWKMQQWQMGVMKRVRFIRRDKGERLEKGKGTRERGKGEQKELRRDERMEEGIYSYICLGG